MSIVDPSRIWGINDQHPLIVDIYSVCRPRLELIMRNLDSQISGKLVNIDDLDSIISELETIGLNIFKERDVIMTFTNTPVDHLINKIVQQRKENVITEVNNFEETVQYGTFNQIESQGVLQQINLMPANRQTDVVYGYVDNNILAPLPSTVITEPLDANAIRLIEPFIYKKDGNGEVQKLYLYRKSQELHTETEKQYIKIKKKTLNIVFVTDPNSTKRYTIDYTSGVKILINLNNPIVKSNLTNITDNSTAITSLQQTTGGNPILLT